MSSPSLFRSVVQRSKSSTYAACHLDLFHLVLLLKDFEQQLAPLFPRFRAYSLSIGTELMIKKINIHAHLILPQMMGKAGAAGPEIIWHDDGRASLRIGSRFTKLVSVASRVDE